MKKALTLLLSLIVITATVLSVSVVASAAENEEFMIVREAELGGEIVKNKIPTTAFSDQSADGKNENTRLTKSAIGISDSQMFRVTRTTADTKADNSLRRMATIYTNRKSATNAEGYMYYIELPEELDDPIVEISWNLYDGDSDDQKNGHIYNGTVYALAEGSKTWTPTPISDRFFELPTGFKGFLLFKPAECSEIGTSFDKNWQLLTTHVYVHGLKNQTVLISRPFMVERIGNMSFAAHIGDDTTTIKDLFSGDTLTAEEAVYKMKVGDVLYGLPYKTADLGAEAPDLTYLPTKVDINWKAIDGAVSYSARLFLMKTGAGGKTYTYEKEVVTDKTTARFEALTENARYYVVVYALDVNGKEIGNSDYVDIYALRGINFDKPDKAEFPTTLVIIIAAAVLIVAIVIVVIIVVSKKKKANK